MNHLITKPIFFLLSFVYLFATKIQAQNNTISIDDYYQEGVRLHDLGNYLDAEAYYGIAISMNPNCDNCFYNRGLARIEMEKYNKALADFNSLINLDPTDMEAYEQRGHLRYLNKDFSGAITDLSTVINNSPSSAAYTNRGMAYLEMKQYPDAIRDLEVGLQIDPADGETQRTLGDALFAVNQPEDAISHYNKAIRINERDIIAYNNRGNAYQLLEREDEALADYNTGIKILENSYTYTNRAKFWIKKQNYDQALIDGRAASRLDFNNPEAYYCVGLVENAMKNYTLAAENFNKAIALDHKRADYYNGRGLALFHLKEYKDAQTDFESALVLNPADAAAKDRIADCYQRLESTTAVVAAMNSNESEEEEEEEIVDEFTERGGSLVSYNIIHNRIGDENNVTKKEPLLLPDLTEKYYATKYMVQPQEDNNLYIAEIEEAHTIKTSNQANNVVVSKSEIKSEIIHPSGEVFTERGLDLNTVRPSTTTTSLRDQALQHLEIANNHLKSKWYDQAIEHYTTALETDPSLKEGYYKRAQCYMANKTNDLAIADLDEYLLIVPTDANAFNDRGTLHFRTGNIFGALEDYNAGLNIDRQHAMLYSNRGRWYMFMGYFNKAIVDFTRALEDEGITADIYYQRALANYELQNYVSVVSDVNMAIEKSNIDRYEYYFLNAQSQLLSLQLNKALKNFNKTIELSPRLAEAYIYRAVTYRQLDLREEACEDYHMAENLGFESINLKGVEKYCGKK